MNGKKSAEPSPESIARSDRKRLAAEEGVRALAEVERQAVLIRSNMARLREMREAKEAADEAIRIALPAPTPKRRSKKWAR